MIKAGIIGATGYAGTELYRLLLAHPNVTVAAVSSVSFEGKTVSSVYPSLLREGDATLVSADEVIAASEVVFGSLPHGLSEDFAQKTLDKGGVYIDLGADFRLDDAQTYEKWYGKQYLKPELHSRAVYGLNELYREDVAKADIIGNPGCYPTAVGLGLYPAIKEGLIDPSHLIADAKSGVTGAGREPAQAYHFPENNEAFSAYKAGMHRHGPEIEQTLQRISGGAVSLTFVPHLLPVNRGIEATLYAKLQPGVTMEQVRKAYESAYADEYFVRLLKEGDYANIRNVRLSNFCDLSLHADEHSGMLIVCSCIDNMIKGCAGQAIQNMNVRFGLEHTAGLKMIPPAF